MVFSMRWVRMKRSLTEDIERGRIAIAAAREQGIDTKSWEERLGDLERQLGLERLLSWASQLAEQDIELPRPVTYVEAPLRSVTTTRISWYARQYLTTIASARLSQSTGGCGRWTPDWLLERKQEAVGALRALHDALPSLGSGVAQ